VNRANRLLPVALAALLLVGCASS
ncbi:uncharacterized protein METZ01_LOCUS256401, partial [marine metagenome]